MNLLPLVLLFGQSADFTIPTVGQPSPFYQIVSSKLKVVLTSDRQALTPDDWLVLTIRLEGVLYPSKVTAPDLSALEGFGNFQIESVPQTNTPEGVRVFAYKLRPRSVEVSEIPEMIFHYFDPARDKPNVEARRKYAFVRSDAIPLTVTPAVVVIPKPRELVVPDYVFKNPTGERLLQSSNTSLGEVFGLVLPPVLLGGGYLVWLWRNPSAARRAKAKRNRAARHALAHLKQVAHSLDPLTHIDTTIRIYFADRFGLPSQQLPSELPVDVALNQDYQALRDILERDRFRPQQSHDIPATITLAENLILGIENA